ncbi:unnamed protein product [Prunus armeniaca]|uniref:Uncharacterized protein n=1 Tax=Prunus armeniaca TaxID=36596 RepID=A0A6J5WRF9_PRUAR|nr:unnamed protein product [Prunus armeniaca]
MMSDTYADDGLLHSLSTRLNCASPLPSRSSIYRVPETLRRHNEMAPNLVSIGPFHYGRPRLQAMEETKMWYLKCLLPKQTPDQDNCLVHLVNIIKKHEKFCRDCYEERVPLSSDDFVEMMLVDGCFIIELLRKYKRFCFSFGEGGDAIFRTPRMLSTITNDLLLVENQLPWRVLDCLFKVTRVDDDDDHGITSLRQLACLFFQNPTFVRSFDTIMSPNLKEEFVSSHLLETVRNFVVQDQPYVEVVKDIEYRTPIPSVSELLEIGVKFVASDDVSGQLNITFRNGVMEIPPIIIRANGECFIRNLIAYEQCTQKPEQCHMTSYAILFSHLIEYVEDVDFLIQKEIITTELSKVSTASFFKRLSNGTEATGFFYGDLAKEVNEYIKRRWLKTRLVRVKRNYLYNPSSFWSVSNGVAVILILTLTQTIFTVLSYYK